jgi:acyl-coenzyme A synthetase/AMP-(fatty) acid ligase
LDVIKTGGFKVGAGEIEDVLRGHDEVADVAVTGEPDPDLGQRIVAWIVPRAGCTPSRATLEARVAEALTPHKRPRVIHFLDDLPRNSMGKVEKRKLTPARAAQAVVRGTPDAT